MYEIDMVAEGGCGNVVHTFCFFNQETNILLYKKTEIQREFKL